MNTFNLRLDLDKSSQIQVVTLRQGDVDGTTIAATVYDHGALADLSGISSAYIEFALPDGTHYYRGAASVSGSVVTALVDESQAASVPGRACNAYFSLVDGTNEYSTASFVVAVLRSAVDGMELAESWDNEIQAAIQACWDAAQGVTVADGSITTPKIANGAVTHNKLADAVLRGYVHSFETVATMQAATWLKSGMTCHTNGFHAAGDGGAAWYEIKSTGTADGSNVIACANSLYAHRVARGVPFTYNERSFTGANGNVTLVHYAIIPSDYKPELVLANDAANSLQYEIDAAFEKQASVLINAGIFNTSTGNTEGVVITDGVVRKNDATTLSDRSVLFMTNDGKLSSVDSGTLTGDDIVSTYHPVWAVTAFYPFVENGTFTGDGYSTTDYEPRSCIAQDASGNYLVLSCSGRKRGNQGMSLADMYSFMGTIGFNAQFAYNLDGGASASLTIMGVRTNDLTDSNHRSVANFIAFRKSGEDNEELFHATRAAAQFVLRNNMQHDALYSATFRQYLEDGKNMLRLLVGVNKTSTDYQYYARLYEAYETSSGLYRIQTQRLSDNEPVTAFALNSNYKIGELFGNNIATQKMVNLLSWSYRSAGTYALESSDTANVQKLVAIFQQGGKNFTADFYFYNFGPFGSGRNSVATPNGDVVYIELTMNSGEVTYAYSTPASGGSITLLRLVGVDHM